MRGKEGERGREGKRDGESERERIKSTFRNGPKVVNTNVSK